LVGAGQSRFIHIVTSLFKVCVKNGLIVGIKPAGGGVSYFFVKLTCETDVMRNRTQISGERLLTQHHQTGILGSDCTNTTIPVDFDWCLERSLKFGLEITATFGASGGIARPARFELSARWWLAISHVAGRRGLFWFSTNALGHQRFSDVPGDLTGLTEPAVRENGSPVSA
jgi:hypothetical protein